jgi:uncharacterized protein YjaG (DUF416 family)
MNIKKQLEESIQKSSNKRLLEFAIEICERQQNDYSIFHSLTKFGNPDKIQTIIAKLKTGEVLELKKIEKWICDLEKICPDSEDFPIAEVSYALNSVTSIIDLLNFIKTKKREYILNISTYYLDSIYFKVCEAEKDDKEIESEMKSEMSSQIEFLNNCL